MLTKLFQTDEEEKPRRVKKKHSKVPATSHEDPSALTGSADAGIRDNGAVPAVAAPADEPVQPAAKATQVQPVAKATQAKIRVSTPSYEGDSLVIKKRGAHEEPSANALIKEDSAVDDLLSDVVTVSFFARTIYFSNSDEREVTCDVYKALDGDALFLVDSDLFPQVPEALASTSVPLIATTDKELLVARLSSSIIDTFSDKSPATRVAYIAAISGIQYRSARLEAEITAIFRR